MCEQSEINYLDGDVVWVKLGSCWWPGEVVGAEKLPPDVLPSFRKPPIAVVKFFQESTYEYVKNHNSIHKYNCSRKNEFINKGLYMYRTKHGLMDKFPEDVIRAETAVGGDLKILLRDEFQEEKKESYAGLFGSSKKTPGSSSKRGHGGRGKSMELSKESTPIRKLKEKSNYKVHILVQGSKTPSQSTDSTSTPSTSRAGSEPVEDKTPISEQSHHTFNTPIMSSSGVYSCHACPFTTTRLNVLIMHNKSHSVTYIPYTPSPIKKKLAKIKTTPNSSKTPKVRKQRQETKDKSIKNIQAPKRVSEETVKIEVKKAKTDEEIKSSLLADWDDIDEEPNDIESPVAVAGSPEVPVAAESPAVPTPAELPSAQIPAEIPSLPDKKFEESSVSDKPESSSDSKYEFCEDEDWHVETDAGRKIPRVTNPSIRKEDTKSLSIDDDDVAKDVAELLNKTAVPELPSVPQPLRIEENFPELSIAKSPDKKNDTIIVEKPSESKSPDKKDNIDTHPPKIIFKTKTFFRSRHSRSQDVIGKYVAEQLNAAERIDISESEINGTEVVSSPETRESPPVEHVKVARLAPKIQLKKMKAEAAQLREKEKNNLELLKQDGSNGTAIRSEIVIANHNVFAEDNEYTENFELNKTGQDVNISKSKIEKPGEIETKLEDKSMLSHFTSHITCNEQKANLTGDIVRNSGNKEIDIDMDSLCDTASGIEIKNESSVKHAINLQLQNEQTNENNLTASSASAVDALLSVSCKTDRVTNVISDDPPEDLFEDDNKDSISISNLTNTGDSENKFLYVNNAEAKKSQVCNDLMDSTTEENKNTENKDRYTTNICEKDLNVQPTNVQEITADSIPSECDLQIAEALINLPSTAIQNKLLNEHKESNETSKSLEIKASPKEPILAPEVNVIHDSDECKKSVSIVSQSDSQNSINNESINVRFETEQEKSENLNAAQSLVQMSESIDHKYNFNEANPGVKIKVISENLPEQINNNAGEKNIVEQKVVSLSNEINSEKSNGNTPSFETKSSKLLKILEEPNALKLSKNKTVITKQVIVPGKEKILNFDVGKQPFRSKPQSPKQKIIIRRTTPSKNLLNNVNDVAALDKIILSRSNKSVQDGSSVQTYTIQTSPETPTDANTIVIQPKIRKLAKPTSKLQKIKPQTSIVTQVKEPTLVKEMSSEDTMFDINSMPIVLSDDILTPENIEKMPIVMSDGNIITNSTNPPKLVKTKQTLIESEKIAVNPVPSKSEIKTIIMNTNTEASKVTSPNILSKSSKLRGGKPMLVIDKATGKQKIIMTKSESIVKEIKQPTTTLIQPISQNMGKTEKFIILPTPNSPRPGRTQKIVIDPQTGKTHVLVGKGPEATLTVPDNKPVSAKLIPSASDANTSGNTVMIITNAQGAQSRIVLSPEHEKILFPNKQANVSQLKPITQRMTTNSIIPQKTVVTPVTSVKAPTRIVPKQKNAIITSKGQLIVSGRVGTTHTTQNIAPMPEIRPALKRIVSAESKKIVQTIQKNVSEPLIFIQQKSGTVVQLTAAQFEHLQRTGQIVQKSPAHIQENKIIMQKSITLPSNEPGIHTPKQRVRKGANEYLMPPKKVKQDIAIAPAPAPIAQMPALTPISNALPPLIAAPNTASLSSASTYQDLDNLEELLPSTAIARQSESVLMQPEPPNPPPTAPLSDGQLLAVPGEHFGGLPGSFYLCVEDNGNYSIVDNRPLMLENNQLVPMAEPLPLLIPQPERRDILEAALANSDVFHAETRDEAPDFRDLNANVSVHCGVSETSSTLNQPIMTPVEVPTKVDGEPNVPSSLEDGLAVIGVTPHTVPTSLELPITVTDPRIAPKTTDPLSNNNYGAALLPSPNTQMTFVSTEEVNVSVVGPLSMPLLTEEESVGKSMPILTDDVTERTASSVESTIGSPSSIDVRESESEEGGQWPRRLLTPGSDSSETSAEIPIQPAIKLSVNDLSRGE